MNEKEFSYNGYRFTPAGQFKDYGIKPDKNEFQNISRRGDWGRTITPHNFSHEDFYKAANCEDDLFIAHDGRLYFPTSKNLVAFA